MCVNNSSKVALHSAAAGIEPAISSRKSNALTTTAPSHILYLIANDLSKFRRTRTGVVEYLDAASPHGTFLMVIANELYVSMSLVLVSTYSQSPYRKTRCHRG